MKNIHILLSGLLLLPCLVRAQERPQITNGDFESWTFDGENLPDYFNSFQTADGGYASYGYSSSNRQVKRSTDTRPGSSGRYSCLIWSRQISFLWIKVIAQGNMTTGRIHAGGSSATDADNYNYSDRDGSNTKNGFTNPCAMPFTGRPDSLVAWVKFVPNGTDSSHPYAKVAAIIHDDCDYRDIYNQTFDQSKLVATAANNTIAKTNGWKRISVPFVYTGNSAQPKYILLSAATNAYPGGGHENDQLFIDDIQLIYQPTSFDLSIPSQGWASMYVDFPVKVPSGCTAYYVTELVAGYAKMTAIEAGSTIPAKTAVIVKGTAGTTASFVRSPSRPVTVSGNILKGTVSDESCGSRKVLVLSSGSEPGRALFAPLKGTTLAANKAYIEVQ